MFAFQKLEVYQEANDLVIMIYKYLERYPTKENFALGDQLRRAVISVPSNIAEGMSRVSPKEQVHFLEIAYGSLMEVVCQIEISQKLKYITDEDYKVTEQLILSITKKLSGLRKSIKARIPLI